MPLIVLLPPILVLKVPNNVRDNTISLSDGREDTCETNPNQHLKIFSTLACTSAVVLEIDTEIYRLTLLAL